jgi:hypothetical protein
MHELINIWVPENTPINTKPISYLFTKPEGIGWKQIQVPKTQFEKWQSNTIENCATAKNILLG